MASMALTFNATAGTVTSTSPTLDSGQETKYLDWAWAAYPQYEADGVTLKPKTNANVAAAIKDHHRALWRGIVDNVMTWEQGTAAETARAGVTRLPDTVT